jgi:hypothetical protein
MGLSIGGLHANQVACTLGRSVHGQKVGSEGAIVACRTLLRRRTQLALLADACGKRVSALLVLRGRSTAAQQTELLALERDGIVLSWIDGQSAALLVSGQPVEVRFEHGGEHYVFGAIVRELLRPTGARSHTFPMLKLSLPLRLERARPRKDIRLALTGVPPIMGTLTHVVDTRRQFDAQVTDIADGGVGVRARAADVARLHTGDLYWLELKLPDKAGPCEFVVRLAYLRPVNSGDELAMGWVFQPTDDAANYEKCLRRLEQFVAR